MRAIHCRRPRELARRPRTVGGSYWRSITTLEANELHQQRLFASLSDEKHRHAAGSRARSALAHEYFRTHGHRLAFVNPLRRDGLMVASIEEVESALPPTLRPLVRPLVEARRSNCEITLPSTVVGTHEESLLVSLLNHYCLGIGFEFMHCATHEERKFFIDAIEDVQIREETPCDDTVWCYEQVLRSGAWERLLGQRYPTCRRFSLEGLESAVLALNVVLDTFSGDSDKFAPDCAKRVILGSLHRGRLNLLHTVLQRSASSLLSEWDPTDGPTYDDINLGHSTDIITKSGHKLHISLAAMPAHLESQDASIAGKARGHMVACALKIKKSPIIDDTIARSILPLLVHGDASFCGQGIVSESLQLSTFKDFNCGGTIHVILNNQIGFTSETQHMRSNGLVNISDLALSIRAPVLHVNGELPRDVLRAARLATQYRQRFGNDVILDIWGFRKYGHNELDEPRVTNVSLYQEVDQHCPVAEIFATTLSGPERYECERLQVQIESEYQDFVTRSRCGNITPTSIGDNTPPEESQSGDWLDFMARPVASDVDTGVELQDLKLALATISDVPEGFTLHQATSRAVSRRIELLNKLEDPDELHSLSVDWASAELIALSTLANEGHFCRLCGQDSQRGTFCQRHAVWHDAVTGDLHHALPPSVQVVDSPLSELGVLGFEHGFSLASPNFLVLWEAQFADFVNNSQVLIDTMFTSEKEKFGLESNLVLLLPHGYDGMGPEHSSSRLERFLTLHTDTPNAEELAHDELEILQASNFLVAYPTSPSNYFHLLRRSFTWPFRRPMVVLTPKRTLRLAQVASPVSEFLRDNKSPTTFSSVLDDPRHVDCGGVDVESIVVCSGELFYDVMRLMEGISEDVSKRVAILRVEQLAPFPLGELKTAVAQYPNARRAVWVQEEPENMGALRFVAPFLTHAFSCITVCGPISRPVSAAPAVGNPRDHQASQHELLSRIESWVQ